MISLKLVSSACLLATASAVSACDLCNVYSSLAARGDVNRGFHAGIAEQFSHFRTLQDEGMEISNPDGEKLDSSIIQFIGGYNFSDRVGMQFNVPVIYRSFRRVEDMSIESGIESGLGDVTLLGHFELVQHQGHDTTLNWFLLGGLKLPTGDSARLGEEAHSHIGGPEISGVHDHDLALGSGSVDGVLGTGVFARWQRLFFSANVQWAIRTEGDFDYQFADDVTWSGGPGVFLALAEDFTLALQAVFTGETKGEDEVEGMKADDTAITTVYLGPQVSATWKDRLSAEVGAELPVHQWNSGLQLMPDYRIRGAVTFRF